MSFLKFVFAPKLFKEYGNGPLQSIYEPVGIEKYGDRIISMLSLMWNFGYYSSPFLMTFLYRRGYFVAESISPMAKFTTGIGIIIVISMCMRGLGRSQSTAYSKFVKAFDLAKTSDEGKQLLRRFDFDFKHWKGDFDVKRIEGDDFKRRGDFQRSVGKRSILSSSLPFEILAYIAIHTFGIRMIYPGSVSLLQSYLRPMLIQGRAKLIEEDRAERNKVITKDRNEIDTMFVDNRNRSSNGKTLIICSEGNAGFYEIGIMSTPISLNYSVLGWNHPGFDGSTGKPFPSQDQNAIDAVIQFAIHKLNFTPDNIVMYGWSIGGYSSLWAGAHYPDLKGIILDATFDDILYLAIPRMPEAISSIVKIAIRDYVNLNNSELISEYNGPVLFIRRTDDEIIADDGLIETNRGNFLLLGFLKRRFPHIFQTEQLKYVKQMLSKPIEIGSKSIASDQKCISQLSFYLSENTERFPSNIGVDYSTEQRSEMADFLVRKHLKDYTSTHCTPLPNDLFVLPWDIPHERGYVFT